MKKTLLGLFFIFLSIFNASACSCFPYYSFCEYKAQINPDLILTAEIIDTNQHGIRLRKLQVLEGVELRDTIPVWNDTDFFCTGTISMRASQIGQVGDTVIVMLPRIDTVYTSWGITNDYRTPPHLCGRAFISIKNDSLVHAPNTYYSSGIPPQIFFSDIPSYNDFLTYYNQYGDCDSLRKGDFAYRPFPETVGVYWTDFKDVTSLQQSYHYQSRIAKDTIIDNMIYQKIQRMTKHTIYHSVLNVSYSEQIFGYFRNDSLNKKVYLRLPGTPVDTLLYDFDLQLGDTINETYIYNFTSSPGGRIVDSIKFIEVSGNLHRAFIFSHGCGLDTLIEGIGWTTGALMNSIPCFLGATYNLECLSINRQSYYPNTTFKCDLITGMEERNQALQKSIRVFPNPLVNSFQIKSPVEFMKLELYSLSGQLIKRVSGNVRSLKLDEPSGVYMLRLESRDGKVFHKKIIKH